MDRRMTENDDPRTDIEEGFIGPRNARVHVKDLVANSFHGAPQNCLKHFFNPQRWFGRDERGKDGSLVTIYINEDGRIKNKRRHSAGACDDSGRPLKRRCSGVKSIGCCSDSGTRTDYTKRTSRKRLCIRRAGGGSGAPPSP